MSPQAAFAWLVVAAFVLTPALASAVCWFRTAPLPPPKRFFAGLHGVLFLASLGASMLVSPFTKQHEALVLPLMAAFAVLCLVAFASAITALVVHRRSWRTVLVLALALPIEGLLAIWATLGPANINLGRWG